MMARRNREASGELTTESTQTPSRIEWGWRYQLADHVTRVRCSPDGAQLAVGSLAGEVVILDSATGDVVAKLGEHAMGTLDLEWSPDGRRLATAGQDGRVVVWNMDTYEAINEVRESGWALVVRWNTSGSQFVGCIGKRTVLCSYDGVVLGWFGDQVSTVTDAVWWPDDRRVGLLAYGGVRWFGSGRPKLTPDKFWQWKGSPLRGTVSPSGRYLAHGNQDNSIHLWVMSNESELQMGGYPAKVEVLQWNRNGDYLAAGTIGGTTVWDCSGKGPRGRSALTCGGHDRRVTALAWQRHGDVLVTGSADKRLHWYNPTNKGRSAGKEKGSFSVESEVSDLAFLPDDQTIAVALSDGTVGVASLPIS
jgi:WD40 repeat protein